MLGILGVASLTIIVLAALLASRDNQIGRLKQVKSSSKTDETPVIQQTILPPEKSQGLKHYNSSSCGVSKSKGCIVKGWLHYYNDIYDTTQHNEKPLVFNLECSI